MVSFLVSNRIQWGVIYFQRLARAARDRVSQQTIHGLINLGSPRRRRGQLFVIGFIVTCILFLHFGYLMIVDNYYTRCHNGMSPLGSRCDDDVSHGNLSAVVRHPVEPPGFTFTATGTGNGSVDPDFDYNAFLPKTEDHCPVFVHSARHTVVGSPFPVVIQMNQTSERPLAARQAFSVSVLHQDARHGYTATGQLYYGAGSTSALLTFPGHYTIQVQVNDSQCQHPVIHSLEVHPLEGALKEVEKIKFSNTIIWKGPLVTIREDVFIPRGEILKVVDGTTVLLAPNVNIIVEGELNVGTMTGEDTLVTCAPDLNGSAPRGWGQILVLPEAVAHMENTWITCGGGNQSSVFSHSGTQAVVEIRKDGVLTMLGGGLVDNQGTALGADGSTVQLHDTVISRCDMGGEFHKAILDMERSFILEIPSGHFQQQDRDNDALYFHGSHPTGTYSRIRGCVFAIGDDDAIQTDGAFVIVKSSVIDTYFNNGVSSSGHLGGDLVLSNLFVTNCHQALKLGHGNPKVSIHNCQFFDNGVGIRYGDTFHHTEYQGTLDMSGLVIARSLITPIQIMWMGSNEDQVIEYQIDPHRMTYKCIMVDEPMVLPLSQGDPRPSRSVQDDNEGIACMVKVTHDMLQEASMAYGIQLTDVKTLFLLPANMTRDTCPKTKLRPQSHDDRKSNATFLPSTTVSHFRLSDIRNYQEFNSTLNQESNSRPCNLHFQATLHSFDASGACRSQLVQIGADSADLRHDRTVLTCALDAALGTSLCPSSFQLLLDASLPQADTGRVAERIRSSLECIPKMAAKYIPTLATVWSPDVKHHPWPDASIANNADYSLVLFLANCQMAPQSHHVTQDKTSEDINFMYTLLETSRCLGRSASTPKSNSPDLMDISTSIFFKQQHLCTIKREVMEVLNNMSAVNSRIPSLGMMIKQHVNNTPYLSGALDLHLPEIDARVSMAVSEYTHKCLSDVFSELHEYYRSVAVVRLEPLFDGLYLSGLLQEGFTGVFKPIWLTTTRSVSQSFVNQGPAELVTHYVDLVLGFRLTPVVVLRRLMVTPGCDVPLRPGSSCPKGHATINMPLLKKTGHEKHLDTLLMQTQLNQHLKQFYINFAFVPLIKDLQMGVEVKAKMFDFYRHKLQMEDMEQHDISVQDLRDVADIILFDFLTHNPGRYSSRYWARSEGRFFAFDNSFSFWHLVENPVCGRLLACPPIFCSRGQILDASRCPVESSPQTHRLCRFNRNSITRLMRIGPAAPLVDSAGFHLRRILEREPWYGQEYLGYFGTFDVPKSLDMRIKFALEYVEQCRRRFGEDVFI